MDLPRKHHIAAPWRMSPDLPLAMAAMVRFDGSMIWQAATDGGRTAEQEHF
jgi:hypothetical protein